jgi:hypothetical protein
MTVPTNLAAALQGIAAAAKTAGDSNAISICMRMWEDADFALTPYLSAATSSTTIFPEFYPAGSITPSHDTIFDLGVTNISTIGG